MFARYSHGGAPESLYWNLKLSGRPGDLFTLFERKSLSR